MINSLFFMLQACQSLHLLLQLVLGCAADFINKDLRKIDPGRARDMRVRGLDATPRRPLLPLLCPASRSADRPIATAPWLPLPR
jgi:hypothetical protein